jgi:outer membrane protein assembly factor BamB
MNDPHRPVRWKIGVRIALLGIVAITWVRWREEWPFQQRNLISYEIGIVTGVALSIWWLFLSHATWTLRLRVTALIIGVCVIGGSLVRITGVSGDLVPAFEWRWKKQAEQAETTAGTAQLTHKAQGDFPQFYGPNRNGVLAGPKLSENWSQQPPQIVWKHPIGAGWSGFAVVGDVGITQEQQGEDECVTAFDLMTGRQRWIHRDATRYNTTIGGEGPRATPTIVQQRVFTLGSTGILNCLELATGKAIWTRDVVKAVEGRIPEWGAASSPLIVNDFVIVHGGERGTHSLVALRTDNGEVVWKAGKQPSYATPVFATLAGISQVITFHHKAVAGHDVKTGATLWERPWGTGNVLCASPVVIGDDRVLFSSGYGVGAELLKLTREGEGLRVESLWHSMRMKAKFAHLFVRDGCVFGLDDGILACADLQDGSKRWRDGRYGHGQGLAVGDHYLLMAESGELVLLHPTRDAPNELARFRVLNSKTWNPIALAGDLLLVRNDREEACLRMPLAPP